MKSSSVFLKQRMISLVAARLENLLQKPRSFSKRAAVSLGVVTTASICIGFCGNTHTQTVMMALGYLSILTVSLMGGTALGVIAALVTSAVIDYAFTPPLETVLGHGSIIVLYLVNVLIAVLTSLLIAALRVSYEKIDQACRQANEATLLREETLAIVSHDLKNPLTNLSLNCNIILPLLTEGDPKLIARRVGSMQRSIQQMDQLIRDLLDASMLDARKFSVKLGETELFHLLHGVFETQKYCAERKGVILELNEAQPRPFLKTDAKRLEQSLSNIVSNAIKFSPRGGKVSLNYEHGTEGLKIYVSDQGPGIPKENHEKIFHRNWQAKETAYLGSGLGLYIAQGIIEALGGKITLTSEIGKGTVFCISFPAAHLSKEKEASAVEPTPLKTVRGMPPSEPLSFKTGNHPSA